jgi:hypothetical protein
MTDADKGLTPEQIKRVRSAFLFRMGYVAVLWLGCVVILNTFVIEGSSFGVVITVLTFALPVVMALIAPMDWRWLNKHPDAVTRFGLRAGGDG